MSAAQGHPDRAPLRIALVTKGFAQGNNDYGLPPLIDLVRSISDRVDVDVYALDYPFETRNYEVFGARVFAFGFGKAPRASRLIARGRFLNCALREHRRQPYDLVHAVWADRPARFGQVLAQKAGVPLITSFYAGEAVWLPQIGYGSAGNARRRGAIRGVLRGSAAITAGSATLAETIRQGFGADVIPLPLGYAPDRFGADGPRAALGLGRHIVTSASFAPVKGLDVILAALAQIAEDSPRLLDNVTWHAIGANPRDGALRRALADRIGALPVVLHEAVPHFEMPDLYRAADLALVGSWHESQCFAAIEAAACGAPALGTAVGILPELASPDWICRPGDAPALAKLLTRILAAPQTWAAELDRQQTWLVENATLDIAAGRFLDLYAQVRRDGAA